MCELFAISCSRLDRATPSLLRFARYSESNDDGWGVGYYSGGRAVVRKQATKASASDGFWSAVSQARGNVIVAHLRLASRGRPTDICDENCHPFRCSVEGREWIFAHNGTLDIDYESRIESEIDSARAFTFLMDRISGYHHAPEAAVIRHVVAEATGELLERYGGTLNYLMSDGRVLFAFCNHRQMHLLRRDSGRCRAILICTQRLTQESWVEIPKNSLLAVSMGDVVAVVDPIPG